MANSDGSEHMHRSDWLTPGRFALLLTALVVVSFPQVVAGLQTFVYRDFGIFSYPLAFHFHECFWRGELPLWNSLNCCGVPFLAQWNTQVLYPPSLFFLIFPLSWSLGVFCLLHLFWAGLGMFLLAERWTQNRLAAGFAGIVFAFSGLMLSSLIWPATVAGLAWMPWVAWLTERAWREGNKMIPLAALTGAMQMLSGGVEAVLMVWVMLGGLWAMDFFREKASRLKMTVRAALVVLLVAGLSAAQLLPFFELLQYSRMQQGISAEMWPMPASGWANFMAPLFHCRSYQGVFMQENQSWANSYYVGVLTVMLAVAGLWLARRERRVWTMGALMFICMILALGDATPVYGWLVRHFNAAGLMRFPVKFVILPVFVLPLMAASAFSKMTFGGDRRSSRPVLLGIWIAGVAIVLALTFWREPAWIAAADRSVIFWNGVMRVIYFTVAMALWFWAGKFSGTGLARWQLLFLLAVWIDVYQQMPLPRTINRAAYEPGLPRRFVPPKPGEGRVQLRAAVYDMFYHSVLPDVTEDFLGRRFSMMGDCNLLDDIPKVDGFYPLYVSRYAALFYNFYKDSQPAESFLDFVGVTQALVSENDKMEWQQRGSALPLLTAGQGGIFADDLAALQILTNANFNARRMVVLPSEARRFISATNAVAVNLRSVTYQDQKIEASVDSEAPTMVVAAQIYYPQWRAYVDDMPARIWPANYAFQGFEIPAGSHHIKLVYEDRRFQTGSIISLGTLAGCLIWWLVKRKSSMS